MKPILKIIILLAITFSFIPNSFGVTRNYKENCTMEACRSDLGIICEENNVCVCKEKSYWNDEIKACISMIGELCTVDNKKYLGIARSYLQFQTISRCPTNAVCTRTNPNKVGHIPKNLKPLSNDYSYVQDNIFNLPKCFCKNGYYPNEKKSKCIEALKLNEKCIGTNITSKCDTPNGLICDTKNSETCICTNHDTIYNEKEKRCLVQIGKNCTKDTFCEKNSICSITIDEIRINTNKQYAHYRRTQDEDEDENENEEYKLIGNSKIHGKCTCMPGYTLNTKGQCVGSHSVACSLDNPCNQDNFLECIDGKCKCQAAAHQEFSGNSLDNSTCKFLVNSPCKTDPNMPRCVNNAECIDGICTCIKGYAEFPTGICMLSYESKCKNPKLMSSRRYRTPNDWSNIEQNNNCNYFQGLGCLNNKCVCFDSSLTWDEKIQGCTAGKNSRCGLIDTSIPRNYDEIESIYPTVYGTTDAYFVRCSKNLTCIKKFGHIEEWTICSEKHE